MVSQTFGWSLFAVVISRAEMREREMESDQLNICCLNSSFKVNMDFYHIKPKPMSQRFCAWISLANRNRILSDGRLKVLLLAGAWGQASIHLQGDL